VGDGTSSRPHAASARIAAAQVSALMLRKPVLSRFVRDSS